MFIPLSFQKNAWRVKRYVFFFICNKKNLPLQIYQGNAARCKPPAPRTESTRPQRSQTSGRTELYTETENAIHTQFRFTLLLALWRKLDSTCRDLNRSLDTSCTIRPSFWGTMSNFIVNTVRLTFIVSHQNNFNPDGKKTFAYLLNILKPASTSSQYITGTIWEKLASVSRNLYQFIFLQRAKKQEAIHKNIATSGHTFLMVPLILP